MSKHKYFLFNKPIKTLSTLQDIDGQNTVKNYLSTLNYYSLHLVGRLDYNTRGALLITTNGVLSYKLMHPSFKVCKKYNVKVKGIPSNSLINNLKQKNNGIIILENIGVTKKRNTWFNIELYTGKPQQIVNIFWGLKVPVIKIIRVSFAKINISHLEVGHIRSLTLKEILILYSQVKI